MKQLTIAFLLSASMACPTLSQTQAQAAASNYQVTAVQVPAKAINYRNLKGFAMIDFKGTVLLPEAKGSAEIRNKLGTTTIKAKFQNLSPASKFGKEYLTYVLWAVTPEGRATNLGELTVKNGKSNLSAAAPFQSMSLIVTAEPYFAASQPSNVVVAENAIRKGSTAKIEAIDAKYELLPRGEYTLNMGASDETLTLDKKTPLMVYQARNAVRIAKASGANVYAPEGFSNAQILLDRSENKKLSKKNRILTAREAVHAAEDSRLIAVNKGVQEGLAVERQLSQEEIASAKAEAAAAALNKEKADNARLTAEMAKELADRESADARMQTSAALSEAKLAQEQAKDAQENAAANAHQAKELRAQLSKQLNLILQTQDTARGLIVNMSDVLFQSGKTDLRPVAREKLAKVAGVVSAYPSLKLEVEGHTDAVGSDSYNQTLSEKRAQAARDYLVSQGVPPDSIVSRGFGKTKPIASNDGPEGRQKNRRIEIVVSGALIGTQADARHQQ
ncbi:MAG: hypothetical protein A2901_05830 [Elusimicrobia bacterium RIFCSPLOWO2_01_FULL_54_10]|nr:MAG: hypothetical protein A2901_05830 [Elusimicrobia bacterium RIFCSPLOWO2_01_FULL_54_10]